MAEKNGLNLPTPTDEPLPSTVRSLDQIDAWIEEIYHESFDRETYEREKCRNAVNERFVLRD